MVGSKPDGGCSTKNPCKIPLYRDQHHFTSSASGANGRLRALDSEATLAELTMRGLSPTVLAFATLAVWLPGAAESTFTPRNSVVAPRLVSDEITIDGVGCRVPATATLTLAAGVLDVRVRKPSVGARSTNGVARLSRVSARGNAVTFTAVADGDRICAPSADETPPESRSWTAAFDVEVGFKQRIGVVHFNFERVAGKPFVVRPRAVSLSFAVSVRRLRWTQFGGRTAVGLGSFKSLVPCPGGCSDDGTPIKVELTRPAYCPGLTLPGSKEAVVFYSKVAFVVRERLGVLRPGTEWISKKLTCPPAGTAPIPIR